MRTHRSRASAAPPRALAACFHSEPSSPAVVPGPNGENQAPHILVSVMARGVMSRCWTRIYFEGEALNGARSPIPDARACSSDGETLIARRTGENGYEVQRRATGPREMRRSSSTRSAAGRHDGRQPRARRSETIGPPCLRDSVARFRGSCQNTERYEADHQVGLSRWNNTVQSRRRGRLTTRLTGDPRHRHCCC
jgi:hypothetical protein